MKTFKKYLSIFCIFALLVTNLSNVKVSYATTVDTASNSIYLDFEGYKGDQAGTVDSIKTYGASYGLTNKFGMINGLKITDAATDRGTSVDLCYPAGANLSYPYLSPHSYAKITTSTHLAFSIKLGGLVRGSYVRLGAGFYFLQLMPDSKVTFLNKNTGISTSTDVWYDVDIRFNNVTGFYTATLSSGNTSVSYEGVADDFKTSFDHLRFGFYYGEKTEDAHLYLDDLTMEQIPAFYKNYKSENDFNSFVSSVDGTDVPDGFTSEGISAGKNGFYSSDSQLLVKTSDTNSLSLTLPITIPTGLSANVYGKLRVMADFSVSDKNADRTFYVGTKNVLTFGSDGNIYAGSLAASYETDTSYNITIKLDTSANTAVACVYDGNTLIASGETSVETTDFTGVALKTAGTSSVSEAYIDNLNIYTDNGLFLTSSAPKSGAKKIKPCDVTAEFSNKIKSVSYATLNGADVEFSISDNKVTLPVTSELEYGKDYTLVLGEAEDVFGEKINAAITFSTIEAKSLSEISISSDASGLTASVSGVANDGGDYSYEFILAKFDGNTNSLLDAVHDTFVLSSAETEFTLSISGDDSFYYEAYLWDSLTAMNAVTDKASFGTEPFADVTAATAGFSENMDTGVVTGSGLGINTDGTSTLIVFKPGKNMSHLASASTLTDVIDFVKQFDNSGKDVFAFTPSAGNGLYSYSLDAAYTSDAFDYIDPAYVAEVYDAINSDGVSFVECIGTYNKILNCDVTELSCLSGEEKAELDSLILTERETMSDGFETITSFHNAYYKSLALVILKNSTDTSLIQSAIEKYGTYFDVEHFAAYKTYAEANNTAKAEVYAALAAASVAAKESFDEIDAIFSPAAVLAAIRNSQTQEQVGNILNDNNDLYLHLDFSGYNKITNKSALHTSLIAVPVDTLSAFDSVFYDAVAKRLKLEEVETDVADGVLVLGNSVICDFEGYTGNDTTLSITNLTNYTSVLAGNLLVEGIAGPTSVKTDRGTSLNLVNRSAAADENQYAGLFLQPKSSITTSAQLKISVQFKELNRPSGVILRGPSTDNQPSAIFFSQEGSVSGMSIFGNATTMKPQKDKWYDFDIRMNVATGYYEASVTCEGNTESFKGINAGLQTLTELRSVLIRYGGKRHSGSETNIWYDDLSLKETEPLYVSCIDEEDFSLFTPASGGTTVPTGFTSSGVVNGKNGFYTSDGVLVMKTTVPGNLSLDKAYSYGSYDGAAYGTMRTDLTLNIADTNADRIIKIADVEIASFTSDGQFVVGSAKTSYTVDTDYKLVIKASPKAITADRGETYYNVVTVLLYDGSNLVFNGTRNIPVGNITGTSLLVSAASEPSETYIKSFNVYNDNGFYISSSSPYDQETDVIPRDCEISFSNMLNSVQKVTLNGSNVSFSITDNKIKADIKSKLLYNEKYTLRVIGAKDIFGETKDFTITFYTSFASKLSDIQITDGTNITASVSGYSCDGNKYDYVLMLAKFDGTSNKLVAIEKTNVSLDSSNKEFTVSIPKTDGAYYEAYVWDSVKGMVAIKNKASLGTNALSGVTPLSTGYVQNMDTLTVTASDTGISGEGRNSLLILKPGKNMSHLSSASPLTDVIDYIGQFDNAETDVYAYTPANGGGKYGVGINGKFTAEAFTYLDASYIAEALVAVNSDGANYVDCIGTYNSVLNVDTTELSQFTSDEKTRLNALIAEDKANLESGFTTVASFNDVYNRALARAVIENAGNGSDVKIAFEKYGTELGVSGFTAHDIYSRLSSTAKDLIYSDIAKTDDLSTLLKIEKAFADAAILRGVQYADNYVEINNIVTDNNSYLQLDLSTYNSLTHQSVVNKALIGKSFESISAFKTAFINAVAAQKSAENSNKSVSGISSGSNSGSAVTLGPVETVAAASYFTDLANHAWAKEAIEALAAKGIVSGKAVGIFDPASNITREEFTKIVINAFVGVDESLECSFTDVAKGSWYYPYVATAQKLGIINGTSSSTFGTGENITRQDMTAILYRVADMCGIYLEKGSLSFNDSANVSDYAIDAVAALSASGIINGKGNNMFEPVAFATRAESAKMVYGLSERGDN